LTEETKMLRRVLPTITFTDSMTVRHGGREFRFMSVTGDQEGTTVLYLPRERVLVTGDAVSFPMPYVSRAPRQQVAALKMLADLHAAVIVPGHGPAFHDNAFIDLERRFIEAVISAVDQAHAQGTQSVEELQRVVTVDSLRDQFAHGDLDVERRYRERVKALVGYVAAE
jgi:glyoxylase-like metal-dependent hydrolase (beta-lactamase superfamily II)